MMLVKEKLRFAVIGCGLIGQRRIGSSKNLVEVTCCCDVSEDRANGLARICPGAAATTSWEATITRGDVDAVFICTSHDQLATITRAAAAAGKHVLVEKPGARNANELEGTPAIAARTGSKIRVGFNHRYHRSLQKAREIVDSGVLEDLLYIRARYGHGGRIGYDQEWRANPAVSGGGEGVDQGVHLIDLARWFLGDLSLVAGRAPTYFWNMCVEDNAFLLLESSRKQVAFLHATWTEWKNLFSFEITGRMGKLEISGLGGSYGPERLSHYQMQPEMGPPPTTIYEYPMPDNSWEQELLEFLKDIQENRKPCPGIEDALAALQIIEALYQQQKP